MTTDVLIPPQKHECVPPREQIERLTSEEAKQYPDAEPAPPMLFGDDVPEPKFHRRVAVRDGVWGDPPYPLGTIWKCQCGKLWEVCPPYESARWVSLVNQWKPVGRWRTWRLRGRMKSDPFSHHAEVVSADDC